MKITNKFINLYLKQKLSSDPKWAYGALMRIYERQTAGEQMSMCTNVDNAVGFTGADAEILTSFANQYKSRGFLSPKQMKILFKKAPKYRKQLLTITSQDKLFSCMLKDNMVTPEDVEAYKDKIALKKFVAAL